MLFLKVTAETKAIIDSDVSYTHYLRLSPKEDSLNPDDRIREGFYHSFKTTLLFTGSSPRLFFNLSPDKVAELRKLANIKEILQSDDKIGVRNQIFNAYIMQAIS